MRTCLQNFSNTEFMTAGASYGAGVYTATQVSAPPTSVLHMQVKQVTEHKNAELCIAMAELGPVIDAGQAFCNCHQH